MLIEAAHLRKTFGATVAVEDFTVQVAPGEIYGLVGPDGAGKTTVLRMLCGAYLPDLQKSAPASIRIAGEDMLLQVEKARAQIGYLPQRFSLYEDLTVLENIRFFAEMRGLPAALWRPRCLEILQFVGLSDFTTRRAGQLSGGMKQKLGLAAALVHRPAVLLLDEPTTGVDPVTRQDFWQLLIRLGLQDFTASEAQGAAVLISTPYMDEAARCTRVGFMRSGRLVAEGRPSDLLQAYPGQVVEVVMADGEASTGQPALLLRQKMQALAGVEDVHSFGRRLHLRVPRGEGPAMVAWINDWLPAQGFQVARVRQVEPQLEDVFMSLGQAQEEPDHV